MNKIKINEDRLMNIISESINKILKEAMSQKSLNRINKATDDFARQVYGDEYGKRNQTQSDMYGVDAGNYGEIAKSGIFSVGNQKLSDDTLIINFTSALGCPSMNDCPMTQKACYAVAGENRLPDTRRKNLLVQNLVLAAQKNNMLQGLFDIAELYIIERKGSSNPIKYIRYNEAGDFTNQKMLVLAAKFSKYVKEKYGVDSMAYTARKQLDITQEIDGTPIDQIIKINTSIDTIKHSEGAVKSNFFGIPMSRPEDPEKNLDSNDKTEYITDADANKLRVVMPVADEEGRKSIPILTKGKWSGGEGYYYVCPCSFWKWNKDKATEKFLGKLGITDGRQLSDKERKSIVSKLDPNQKDALDRLLNSVKSPCGVDCAVCHNMAGGVLDPADVNDPEKRINDYNVLTATHGAGAPNYDEAYATAKRGGRDDVAWKKNTKNPHGLETKYKEKMASPNFKPFDPEVAKSKRANSAAKAAETKARKAAAKAAAPPVPQDALDYVNGEIKNNKSSRKKAQRGKVVEPTLFDENKKSKKVAQ